MKTSLFINALSAVRAAAAICVYMAVPAANASVIYGGPTYNSATSSGYLLPGLRAVPGGTAGNGVGVGYARKYESGNNKGDRAIRWDVSGAAATELGHLGVDASGSTSSAAYAVNAVGSVVGFARKYDGGSNKGDRAVRWGVSNGDATALGTLGTDNGGFTQSGAYAVNAAGTTVGYSQKYVAGAYAGIFAVRWTVSGTAATELGNLGIGAAGSTFSYALAINDAGTAIGFATKHESGSNKGNRAVRWSSSGTTATELGNLGTSSGGSTDCAATAINAAGTTVGYGDKRDGNTIFGTRAIRWDASGTAATELDNLGTDAAGFAENYVYDINDVGTSVGIARKYVSGTAKGFRAVRWDASGTAVTELGGLGTNAAGFATSRAYAVNGLGAIIGVAEKYDMAGNLLGSRAVLWGTEAIDLNTLLTTVDAAHWTLNDARGISDTGWLTGIGKFDPDGAGALPAYDRLFLMQIPEPDGLALLAIGAVHILRQRRRIIESAAQ